MKPSEEIKKIVYRSHFVQCVNCHPMMVTSDEAKDEFEKHSPEEKSLATIHATLKYLDDKYEITELSSEESKPVQGDHMIQLPIKIYGENLYLNSTDIGPRLERRIEQITKFFERMTGPCPQCKAREQKFIIVDPNHVVV